MDQQYNPFEDALKETGAAPNPFPVADFFGNANSLKNAAPLIVLGSQPEAENPFEEPDETPDAITSTAQVAKLDETQYASPANSLDLTLHETLDAIPSKSQIAIPSKDQGETPDNDEIPNPLAQAIDKQNKTNSYAPDHTVCFFIPIKTVLCMGGNTISDATRGKPGALFENAIESILRQSLFKILVLHLFTDINHN